jgi:hypothetical protein
VESDVNGAACIMTLPSEASRPSDKGVFDAKPEPEAVTAVPAGPVVGDSCTVGVDAVTVGDGKIG